MKATIKAGSKFFDYNAKKEIKILKVDLKGIYAENIPAPIPLIYAIRAVKDRIWLPA